MAGGRVTAYIGLGTNLGDRAGNLDRAVDRLRAWPGIAVERVSSVRETEPWGDTEQPTFLNAVAEIRTELAPEALLAALKAVEREMGRTATRRWGPRLIDLDILTYGNERVQTPGLTIPHPGLLERPFAWEPLEELAPELVAELRRHAAVSLRSPG